MSSEQKLDEVIAGLLLLHPLLFRKLHSRIEISTLEMMRFRILGITMIAGPLPISEIGKRLFVSRPYMTRLIDGLIAEGLIERCPDQKDRRVLKISITDAGREWFWKTRERLKDRIRELISNLEEGDIVELSDALDRLRKVLEKIP
ncbi:MAG: MarR family transcriptional regulator [Methanoregulaceae archaeon]|jgi:DNA-binding MarR family transcriptional regulator